MGDCDLINCLVSFISFNWKEGREIVPAPGAVVGPEIDQESAFLNGRGVVRLGQLVIVARLVIM